MGTANDFFPRAADPPAASADAGSVEGACAEAEGLRAIRELLDAEWDNMTGGGTTEPLRKQ